MRVLLLVVVGLTACGPSPSRAAQTRAAPGAPAVSKSKDDSAVDRAAAVVKSYHLAKGMKSECLAYVVDNSSHPGVTEVQVLEVHNKKCGGDPGLEPRRFSVYFDKTSGIAVDDTPDGSLRFLKR